jgi:uncharacterized protein (DUF1499 family)
MNRRLRGARTDPQHGDPSLRGSRLDHTFKDVWETALRLASDSPRWQVVSLDPGSGQIVAEVTTPLWKFVDDVVIRLSLDDQGFTRVDLSSHSRKGRYDFGVNRRRIRGYLRRLERMLARR